MNTDLVREPIASEWCTTDMTVDEILMKIKNRDNGSNGGYKTNNVFLRMQSGHGNLRSDQRPGVPYDFRHTREALSGEAAFCGVLRSCFWDRCSISV